MQTQHSISPEQRTQQFLNVFRHFNSVREGAEWIAEVTGSSPNTVMVWRVSAERKTGYNIPYRPYKMLMDAVAVRFGKF